MPQRMFQELRGRKQEKVAPFLTLENLTGVLVFFAPAYIGSGGTPLLIRAPLVIGAAVLGYVLTMEHRGMALYERLILRGRGMLRLRLHTRIIRPEQLAGRVVEVQAKAVPLSGPIQPILTDAVARRAARTAAAGGLNGHHNQSEAGHADPPGE